MKKYILILPAFIILCFQAFGQNTELDIITFIEKYEKYSSFTDDGFEFNHDYEKKFRNLFIANNELIVFNDLGGTAENTFYSPVGYVKRANLLYKKGINVSIEIIDISSPVKVKDKYEVEVGIKKSLFGLNNAKEIYNKEFELKLIIQYPQSQINNINFKIAQIYNEESYQELSGFHVGVCLQPSLANLKGKDWSNSSNEYAGWDQSSSFVFNFGFEFKVYTRNPKINYGARLLYSTYKTSVSLLDYKQQTVYLSDIDNDQFYLSMNANKLNENVSVSFIEIPIFYSYTHQLLNMKRINHIYANIGPSFGIQISNNYTSTGLSTHTGYYPEYHVVLYDIPEYGYLSNYNYDVEGKTKIKSFNVSGMLEAGVNFYIANKLSLDAGVFANIGLLNLSENNESYYYSSALNAYNSVLDSRSKIKTSSYGLNLCIKYKIK